MFTMVHEEKLSPESLRILEYVLSGSHADEYPEHLTHNAGVDSPTVLFEG